jgi:hypothetical protein
VVRHRDSQALAALKMATAAALAELVPHSPRDLSPGAFGKLKTGTSGSYGGCGFGSSVGSAGSVGGSSAGAGRRRQL